MKYQDDSFYWSSPLIFYLVTVSNINLLGARYCRFPLAHGIIHGQYGAIKHINL